jgi:hypothetical protein
MHMTVPTPRRADGESDEGPRAFETLDGDVVFYDPANPDAWMQASFAIDFEEITGADPA